jgi:hypothetical protein
MKEQSEAKIITLTVGGKDIHFEPTPTAYNKALNESTRTEDVMGAMRTYLLRIVCPESREALNDVLKTPGAAPQLAKVINEQFAPALEIEVKQ